MITLKFLRPLLVSALLFWPLHLLPAQSGSQYRSTNYSGGGIVSGTVRFVGDAARAQQLPITKDTDYCGRANVSPRLVVDGNNDVKNAVIILEGVTKGKAMNVPPKVTLNQTHCEYDPHIMVVPVGTQIEIMNSDPILHNVHAYAAGPSLRSLFNIAQPVRGQRTAIRQTRMTTPGLVMATCDAGHPWMSAYIYVVAHPYFALTDGKGRFQIDDIPPGTYNLKMWHEGIVIARTAKEGKVVSKYYFEAPYEQAQPVTIRNGETATVNFELKLR